MPNRSLTVVQVLPALEVGGVERGSVEVAQELVERGHRAIVVSAGGRMVSELKAAGAEHFSLAVGAKRLSTLLLGRRLAQVFSDCEADVVHVRSRLPAWITALAFRRISAHKRPWLVSTVHGPYSVNRYSAVMTRADRVIAISGFIENYLLANYPIDAQRIRLIHRGIDPGEFPNAYKPDAQWESDFRSKYSLSFETPLITQAARITRWKGQTEFLRVMAALKEQGVSVNGLLAGGAEKKQQPFMRELEQLAVELGIEDRIRFLGSRTDVKELLAISAASVSLTLEPEAFGRTTLESVSLGTPVIGYSHGGTAEILEKLYPQGLCDVGDANTAARKIQAVLADKTRLPPHQQFQRQAMLDATLAVYEELAGQSR